MNGSRQGPLTLGSLQVVIGALMLGVVGLLAVVMVVSPPVQASFDLTSAQTVWLGVVVAMVVGAVGLIVVLSRLLLGRASANARLEGRGEPELMADFASFTIVRCAIVEGVGLLGSTVYLIADLGIGLVVAATSLLGLLALFPTASRRLGFKQRVTRPQ